MSWGPIYLRNLTDSRTTRHLLYTNMLCVSALMQQSCILHKLRLIRTGKTPHLQTFKTFKRLSFYSINC